MELPDAGAAFKRAIVPPSKPVKAAVSAREFLRIFMRNLSPCCDLIGGWPAQLTPSTLDCAVDLTVVSYFVNHARGVTVDRQEVGKTLFRQAEEAA